MKTLALAICLSASVASAQVAADPQVAELKRLNLEQRDRLVSAEIKLRAAESAATLARQENIDQNAAFKGEITQRDKKIREQAKTLDSAWVKTALWVRNFLRWVLGIGVVLYAIALFGSFAGTHTFIFKLAQQLIVALPFAQIVERFVPTKVVRSKEIAIIDPPAAVTTSAADPAVAERLAAMAAAGGAVVAEPAAPVVTPPPARPSAMAQAMYGVDFSQNIPGTPFGRPR